MRTQPSNSDEEGTGLLCAVLQVSSYQTQTWADVHILPEIDLERQLKEQKKKVEQQIPRLRPSSTKQQ